MIHLFIHLFIYLYFYQFILYFSVHISPLHGSGLMLHITVSGTNCLYNAASSTLFSVKRFIRIIYDYISPDTAFWDIFQKV